MKKGNNPKKSLKQAGLYKNTDKIKEVPGNILKHVRGNKSLQQETFIIYEFETKIVETDNKSKPET